MLEKLYIIFNYELVLINVFLIILETVNVYLFKQIHLQVIFLILMNLGFLIKELIF